VEARSDRARVGGGSLPGLELDTWVVALRPGCSAERLAAGLRAGSPPVLARVRDDQLLLDVRTLQEGEAVLVEKAVSLLLREDRVDCGGPIP
jgi:L-seryl-tRNA(Ser) seleniumtransferase